MQAVGFSSMSKKDEFIRIRSDEELKAALKEDASRVDRKEADQARYLLRVALGLIDPAEETADVRRRLTKLTAVSHEPDRQKGGRSR